MINQLCHMEVVYRVEHGKEFMCVSYQCRGVGDAGDSCYYTPNYYLEEKHKFLNFCHATWQLYIGFVSTNNG